METDEEGKILNRINKRGFNWGKADMRDYLDRERKKEAFLREDGIRVAVVQLNHDGSCVVRYEDSTGYWGVRTLMALPASWDNIRNFFVYIL